MLSDYLFELEPVLFELPDACRQQVGCHFARVHFVPENCLGYLDLLDLHLLGFLGVEFEGQLALVFFEFPEEFGGNREFVTAAEFLDFASVSKRGSHDNRFVAELLEIIENFGH